MRFFALSLISSCLLIGCVQSFGNSDRKQIVGNEPISISNLETDSSRTFLELNKQIESLKSRIKKGDFSKNIAIFIDMRIPSNQFRFFIVNLKKDSIVASALVAHGSGSETTVQDSLQFSNRPNSYMSSLGTYKIGAAYQGNFGRSYRLIGLDKTNNKAFERAIVLHRYSCVPDEEQQQPICNSLGCPMVSEQFFPQLERFIDQEKLPVLMKIYY